MNRLLISLVLAFAGMVLSVSPVIAQSYTVTTHAFPNLRFMSDFGDPFLTVSSLSAPNFKFLDSVLSGGGSLSDVDPLSEEVRLLGPIYVYPNPLKFSQGNGEITYYLNTAAEVELRVYDVGANLIYHETFPIQSNGGRADYNDRPFTMFQTGFDLSAGAYFIVLMSEGRVLGKAKFAVVP